LLRLCTTFQFQPNLAAHHMLLTSSTTVVCYA